MISQRSKYALRALLALARAEPGETVRISTIAGHEKIPKKFLEQILLELKRAGLVASRRGSMAVTSCADGRRKSLSVKSCA